MDIQIFGIYEDTRSGDEWYVKYADEEIVISRNLEDEGRNRLDTRTEFEGLVRSCVVGGTPLSENGRVNFTGETIPEDDQPRRSETEARMKAEEEAQQKSVFDI